MQTLHDTSFASFEEKKSTFLAYLCPIKEFDMLHQQLKTEHPKAAHIVWAKRCLNEYRQIVENNSDDGEPKGTSGPPVLNVMRGFELVDVGILIVRYFLKFRQLLLIEALYSNKDHNLLPVDISVCIPLQLFSLLCILLNHQ